MYAEGWAGFSIDPGKRSGWNLVRHFQTTPYVEKS